MARVKPKKVGRPSQYQADYCKQLREHLSEGLSFESFGGVVGVCKDTLYEWIKAHSEFSDAKRVGEAAGRLYWEKQGRDGLWQSEGAPKLNTAVWNVTMKNRFGYRDKTEPDIVVQQNNANLSKASEDSGGLVEEFRKILTAHMKERYGEE